MANQLTPEQLKAALDQFNGTDGYYRWSPLFQTCVLTDGTLYLAEQAGAYWLMDAIASHQIDPKVRKQPFQVWKLSRLGEAWVLVCEDGNYNEITRQRIEYSDFPLDEITLFVGQSGGRTVIFLPSEN